MKKAYVGKAEVYNGIWGTYGAPWTYKGKCKDNIILCNCTSFNLFNNFI